MKSAQHDRQPPRFPQNRRRAHLGADDRARRALLHRRRLRRRAGGLHAECLADDRARRHHHHRVAGGRDGPRHLHHAAGHPRRGARRRLGQGQAGVPAGMGREEIRQSGIQLHLPDLGQLRRCPAISSRCASPARRRAASCSMRWRRNGACRSASFRPSRAWSCTRPRAGASAMARSRPLRRRRPSCRRSTKGPQAAGELPPHRQGRAAGRSAAQGHGRRQIRHGRPGARHGLCRGAAIALSGRRAARSRR